MIPDRGHFRRWFILGGWPEEGGPRFDVHLYAASGYFGIQQEDLADHFRSTGGVVIWRGRSRSDMGEPVAAWAGSDGSGAFVYVSADVRARLKP